MQGHFAVLLTFSLFYNGSANSKRSDLTPKVKTNDGFVVGFVKSYKDGDVAYFYGIPYAEPPIGPLRFQKAKPSGRWTGVLKAVDMPPSCYTPRTSLNQVRLKMSEDCLYLNLVMPAGALKSDQRLPVLIILRAAFVHSSSGFR